MTDTISARLEALRAEFDNGQQLLRDLDRRRLSVREQMLRISGAIQVLEELEQTAREADQADGPVRAAG